MEHTTSYGMATTVALPYEEALRRTREELAREGFGILTEIDVAATLRQKLGVSFRPYVILGACNAPLAYRALSSEIEVGLLLPCNVIVYATDEPGTSVVAVQNPVAALELTHNARVAPIGDEAKAALERALGGLQRSSLT